MTRRYQVSFIDTETKKWLDEQAPEDGLCLRKFHADIEVDGLRNMKAGHEFEKGGMRYRITSAGKNCFEECQLLQRTGEKCPLASGAAFGKLLGPSMDSWMEEIRAGGGDPRIGMYLIHNGVVRMTSRAMVRDGAEGTEPVLAMDFSYDAAELDAAVAYTYRMPGIYYIRTWLAEGRLEVGDNIMYVLIGGDIRPHVTDALDYLVGRIKSRCVKETEITAE